MKRLVVVLSLFAFAWMEARAQTIPDQIDSILTRSAISANTWTILIENETGTVNYYQKNPTTGKAPASNTKMFTTSAAFGLLGTNYAFATRIYTNGGFSSGTLTGDLNLICEHDPTWNTSVFPGNARKPLDTIAAALKAKGLTHVTGNVQCYGLCAYDFGSTDDLSSQTLQTKNANAAAAFLAALQATNITVDGIAVGQTTFAPPGGLFHTHYSTNLTYGGKPLRLDIACIPLLKVSHNVMADGILRHIGWKLGAGDSYSAGAAKVVPWLKTVAGVDTNGIVMNDGSGLSHGNRFSARQSITLIRYMLGAFPSWDDGLPIGCVDGTIGGRFCGTDGSGQVHAKTGSLSIAIALSGYINNKYDNRRYLFSFISNTSGTIDDANTRQAIDDCVVLMGARGVPTSPPIISAINHANNSIAVNWSDEKFVHSGYRLYSSSNGIDFASPIDLASNQQNYTATNLAPGTKKYFRVSVLNGAAESPPSRAYGAEVSPQKSPVLIVDGNDRWQFDTTYNPGASNHTFCAMTGQNISGPAFDTANHNAIIDGTLALTNYPAVIWLLGDESTADRTFDSNEQTLVKNYLNGGGKLFVSGGEVGWDLDRSSGPTAADRNFYHDQLRAVLANDDAGTYSILATANEIFDGNAASGFDNGTHGTYDVAFPDVLTPTNGSVVCLLYAGGHGNAGIKYDGGANGPKLVNWGFPFETITNSAARDAYMSDVLRFFSLIDPPRVLFSPVNLASNTITLNWSSSAGLKYRVQVCTNLVQTNWSNLAPDVTATNLVSSKTDSLGSGQKFYRVVLLN